jgi:hypothetical protein
VCRRNPKSLNLIVTLVTLYQRQWAQYRRWMWVGTAMFVLTFALGPGVGITTSHLRESLGEWVWLEKTMLYTFGLAWIYCLVRQQFFRCPRCANFFYHDTFWAGRLPFRQHCVHCDLKVFANA